MEYSKYFKTKQKILLRTITDGEPGQSQVITSYLVLCGPDFFDVEFPYIIKDHKDFPFKEGTEFCLMSDSFGMGIKLTGHFQKKIDQAVIRIVPHDDMEVFSQRKYCRIDTTVEISCKQNLGNFNSSLKEWTSAVKNVKPNEWLSILPAPKRMEINLSGGGVCIPMELPMAVAELCLVMVRIDDGQAPILALSELVWYRMTDSGSPLAGLRFVQITHFDQELINNYVNNLLNSQGEEGLSYSPSREQLDKMHF
jgi:hypothetical protein